MAEPRKIVIEIGLDSSTAPRFDGTYSHLINLVRVDRWDDPKGDPWWFTNFHPGDEIAFRICDYTSRSFGNPLIAVNSFVATFLESKDRRCLSPCHEGGVICTGKDYFPVLEGKSLLVDQADCWRFVSHHRQGVKEKYYKLTGSHRAFLRVHIAATYSESPKGSVQQLRWFTHDPEIIVGEGSGNLPLY